MEALQQSPQTLTPDFFLNHLHKVAHKVEEELEALLPPSTTRLHEAMRYSVLGRGKRLRSFLVWESCQLFDVSLKDTLRTAAAVEFIQAYSLVHDDLPCMDGDAGLVLIVLNVEMGRRMISPVHLDDHAKEERNCGHGTSRKCSGTMP